LGKGKSAKTLLQTQPQQICLQAPSVLGDIKYDEIFDRQSTYIISLEKV